MKKHPISPQKTRLVHGVSVLCILVFGCSGVLAKSLYVAGNSDNKVKDLLWVYDIQEDGTLVMQITKTMPNKGNFGVNGLGVDPNTDTLFLTYDRYHYAGLVDTQTLEWEGTAYMPPMKMDPGGVVFDEIRARFYTTDVLASDEVDDRLLIFDWDAETKKLLTYWSQPLDWTGASSVPLVRENAGPLAFDKISEVVYVAVKDGGVDAYKTSKERGSWYRTSSYDTPYEAQAVTVDPVNQLFYVGGTLRNRGALIDQTNLFSGDTFQFETGEIDEEVLSLSVDDKSSLLYALIGNPADTTARAIKVFDHSFNLLQTLPIAGDARQLLVPNLYNKYDPLKLSITPISGVVENNGKFGAGAGAEIEYQIRLNNANSSPVTDIVLTSVFPESLQFNGASDLGGALGSYVLQTRTFSYTNAFVDANSTQHFSLFATVGSNATAGSVISTTVTVESYETGLSQDQVDVYVRFNALGLTKEVVIDPNFLVEGDKVYVDPGATVFYRICVSNLANNSGVSNVLLTDKLSEHVHFESADVGGIVSFYEEDLHSYSWAFQSIEPNSTVCLNLRVRLKDDLPPGIVISNEILLDGSQTDNTTAQADIVVIRNPLDMDVSIVDSADYNPVSKEIVRGAELVFNIDIINPDTGYTAEDIRITNIVPEGLTFISTNVGAYDFSSRTYRLEQPFLGPGQNMHIELTCLVNNDLPQNSVLTNLVIAQAKGTQEGLASLDVIIVERPVEPEALSVGVSIKPSPEYDPVNRHIFRGGEITYVVDVVNSDPVLTAEDIRIINVVPEGLTFISSNAGIYDPSSRTYVLEQPFLGPGQSTHIELTCVVNDDLPENSILTNLVIAQAKGAQDGFGSFDVIIVEPLVATEALSVAVSIKSSSDYDPVNHQILRGAEITYMIDVGNSDAFLTAEDIRVSNILPEGLTFISANLGAYDPSSRTYVLEQPFLGPGQSTYIELTCVVNDDLPENSILTILIIAQAKGAQDGFGSFDVIIVEPVVEPQPWVNVRIEESGGYDPATRTIKRGGVLTYIIEVTNVDPVQRAEGIRIIDSVPEGLSFYGVLPVDANGQYYENIRQYILEEPFLEPGQGLTIRLSFEVDEFVADNTQLTNSVLVESDGATAFNESLYVTVWGSSIVSRNLDVSIRVKNSGDYNSLTNAVVRGGELVYVIDVNNPDPDIIAYGIRIVDQIPDGLTYIPMTPDDANRYDVNSRQYTWEQPSLAPGANIHLELTCLVDNQLPNNTLLLNSLVVEFDGVSRNSFYPVTVVSPRETIMRPYFTMPLRQFHNDNIMVVMKFVDGDIDLGMVDTTKTLTMNPGGMEATHINRAEDLTTIYYEFGSDGDVRIKGFFNSDPLLNALEADQKTVEIRVTGWLKNQEPFVGLASVPVDY